MELEKEPTIRGDWFAAEVRCRADLDCWGQWLRVMLEHPAERLPAPPPCVTPQEARYAALDWRTRERLRSGFGFSLSTTPDHWSQ